MDLRANVDGTAVRRADRGSRFVDLNGRSRRYREVAYEYEALQLAAARFITRMQQLGHENYAAAIDAVAKRLARTAKLHLKRLARSDRGE